MVPAEHEDKDREELVPGNDRGLGAVRRRRVLGSEDLRVARFRRRARHTHRHTHRHTDTHIHTHTHTHTHTTHNTHNTDTDTHSTVR